MNIIINHKNTWKSKHRPFKLVETHNVEQVTNKVVKE